MTKFQLQVHRVQGFRGLGILGLVGLGFGVLPLRVRWFLEFEVWGMFAWGFKFPLGVKVASPHQSSQPKIHQRLNLCGVWGWGFRVGRC